MMMPIPSTSDRLATWLVLAGAALGMGPAHAADFSGRFSVRDPGSQTRATYLATGGKLADLGRVVSRLPGYLTARNRMEAETRHILPMRGGADFRDIGALVYRNAPAATLESAANGAAHAIASPRQPGASSLAQDIVDGRTVSLHDAALRRLRTALIRKKALSGNADGMR